MCASNFTVIQHWRITTVSTTNASCSRTMIFRQSQLLKALNLSSIQYNQLDITWPCENFRAFDMLCFCSIQWVPLGSQHGVRGHLQESPEVSEAQEDHQSHTWESTRKLDMQQEMRIWYMMHDTWWYVIYDVWYDRTNKLWCRKSPSWSLRPDPRVC